MNKLFARIFPEWMRPYTGRIVLTALGLVAAILFMTLGFWRTLLILLLCAAGYMLGKWEDGVLDTSRFKGRLALPGRRR